MMYQDRNSPVSSKNHQIAWRLCGGDHRPVGVVAQHPAALDRADPAVVLEAAMHDRLILVEQCCPFRW